MASYEELKAFAIEADRRGDKEAAMAAMQKMQQMGKPVSDKGTIADPLGQGVSFGFSDEISGALGAIPAAIQTGNWNLGEHYTGIRDAARENAQGFRQRNPVGSIAAEIGGGLLTGGVGAGKALGGAAARGAGSLIGRSAATGAGLGLLSGTGYSDADSAMGVVGDATKGAAVGGLLGAAFPAAGQALSKVRKAVAPNLAAMKTQADQLYAAVDNMGVRVKPAALVNLSDDIESAMRKAGLDRDLTPQATALLKRIRADSAQPLSVSELETLRKVAGGVAGNISKPEAALGRIAQSKIDDFLDQIPAHNLTGGGRTALDTLKRARALVHQRKKAETIESLVANAQNQATGFENGLRTQFRALLKRIDAGKEKGFTADEVAQIRKIVQGTKLDNALKFLGRFGLFEGQSTNALGATLGGAAGWALGGPAGAVGLPVAGQASRIASRALKADQAQKLAAMAAAGGKQIPMMPPPAISGLLQDPRMIAPAANAGLLVSGLDRTTPQMPLAMPQ